ncbi:MAG: carboxylating nicotinate-nucleotide diphosphorylase [Candidatus Omnitrophica bacterium]|nr:carboxylating nicotinate-nucleotide diphosphorylase [Candidatus Omnitrophota bacterium]
MAYTKPSHQLPKKDCRLINNWCEGKYFLSESKPKLKPKDIRLVIRRALLEDVGRGDITTQLNIAKNIQIKASIVARENFLVCGMELAAATFKTIDPSLKFIPKVKEGQQVSNRDTLAIISGKAASILTAERVALNLLAFLSGIATKTNKFVTKIKPFKTKITDTRKTIPGLRQLQKYAVRIGSGYNHRMRLDEMVLIKDNHLKIMGGYSKLPNVPKGCKIEIETQNLKEFVRALSFKPDIIMLDNMGIRDISKAIKIRNNLYINCRSCITMLEASGGIHLGNVKKYAATGVDIISIGELTDSIGSVDINLNIL